MVFAVQSGTIKAKLFGGTSGGILLSFRLLALGHDPMAQRKAAKTAEKAAAENSFRTMARLWFDHWRAEKSVRHVDATRRRMDANVFPLLGASPISEIGAPELVTMVKMIEGRGAADLAFIDNYSKIHSRAPAEMDLQ